MSIFERPTLFNISQEIIDQQENIFGIALESIFSKIKVKLEKGELDTHNLRDSKELLELVTLIGNRTGLKVKIIHNQALAAILPFYSNKNHVLIHKYYRGNFKIADQEKILKEANRKKGHVDLKKATVSGLFSEYSNHLHLDFKSLFLVLKLSPAEVTAITLHELGHAFYACEYANRIDTVNQVLSNLAAEMTNKKEKDLTYIYRELKSINEKVTEEDVDKIVNGNKIIAGYTFYSVLLDNEVLHEKKQSRVDKYDETAFEQLADNFAARFGYGRQLIIALDKLHRFGYSPEKSKSAAMITEMLMTLDFIFMIIATATLFITILPLGVLMGLITYLNFMGYGENFKDYTYDELKVRYNRIRQEYIQNLKSDDLSKDEIKLILDDIYVIDKIMDETSRFSPLLSKLSNLLVSSNRQAKNAIRGEQLLEELAFNDLYVKSAEFKLMT